MMNDKFVVFVQFLLYPMIHKVTRKHYRIFGMLNVRKTKGNSQNIDF